MLKRLSFIAFCAAGLACAVACSALATDKATSAKQSDTPLLPAKEQVWQLVSMRGKTINANSGTITLTVNPEANSLSGTATCNRYGADCRLGSVQQLPQGDRYTLTIANLDHGNTLCPEADMNAEARYLALLPKADALLMTAYTLTLLQKDKEILRFELQ